MQNSNVPNAIDVISLVDYTTAHDNYFADAKQAVTFILTQLNDVGDDVFEGPFSWFGKECTVPSKLINPVLRALEATGAVNSVIVVPTVAFGPSSQCEYIIKPYLYNPEYPVAVGVVVTSEMEKYLD